MKEVKRVTKGEWTLIHSWYVNDFGFKENSFELVREDGLRVPFMGNLRVNTKSKNDVYDGDDVSPYTNKEYNEMLNNATISLATS